MSHSHSETGDTEATASSSPRNIRILGKCSSPSFFSKGEAGNLRFPPKWHCVRSMACGERVLKFLLALMWLVLLFTRMQEPLNYIVSDFSQRALFWVLLWNQYACRGKTVPGLSIPPSSCYHCNEFILHNNSVKYKWSFFSGLHMKNKDIKKIYSEFC